MDSSQLHQIDSCQALLMLMMAILILLIILILIIILIILIILITMIILLKMVRVSNHPGSQLTCLDKEQPAGVLFMFEIQYCPIKTLDINTSASRVVPRAFIYFTLELFLIAVCMTGEKMKILVYCLVFITFSLQQL